MVIIWNKAENKIYRLENRHATEDFLDAQEDPSTFKIMEEIEWNLMKKRKKPSELK